MKFNAKALYVLGQKWCWGLILLAVFVISVSNTLLIVLWPKPYVEIYADWGREPPRNVSGSSLKELELPVSKIIVAATDDEAESCSTKVCEKIEYFSIRVIIKTF